MSSMHFVPITGAPSGIGAVHANCFARRNSDAGPVGRDRRRTRPSVSTTAHQPRTTSRL